MRPLIAPRLVARLLALTSVALVAAACSTPALSPGGANVVLSRNAPGSACASVKYLVGHGGGTFGGGLIRNDDLVEYAMNDLRNKAGEVGANYVQHDPPQMGHGHGTTTTVTVSGTAYHCSM